MLVICAYLPFIRVPVEVAALDRHAGTYRIDGATLRFEKRVSVQRTVVKGAWACWHTHRVARVTLRPKFPAVRIAVAGGLKLRVRRALNDKVLSAGTSVLL